MLEGSWWCSHVSSPVTICCRKASPSWYHHKNKHSCFHACPFAFICKLLWHPPCTNYVIPKALTDDRICRSTADVQLVSCISDSNPSVLLNWSMNSFNILHHLWSDGPSGLQMMLVLPLWNLYIHWYTFLCRTVFFFHTVLTFYGKSPFYLLIITKIQ